ncbi:MAG: 16S rRNA processing protein RimM [Salinivirgaceae bacterium]|nr:16S rRNA processing protein RimM [Salinivirgaceae bacterium]
MQKQDCLHIGTIIKTHGIHGELILEAKDPDLIENIKESVFLEIEGLLVPFFIDNISAQSTERFRIKFQWVDSDQSAKKIKHSFVYISNSEVTLSDDNFTTSPSLLENFTVIDKIHGELGIIEEIIQSNENQLMVIKSSNKELLIPYHNDFIKKVNSKKKLIYIETPEGLIDLYL